MPNRSPGEEPDISALNIINVIIYHREGLRRVLAGELPGDVFDARSRKTLKYYGILGKRMVVAWQVEVILDRLK